MKKIRNIGGRRGLLVNALARQLGGVLFESCTLFKPKERNLNREKLRKAVNRVEENDYAHK